MNGLRFLLLSVLLATIFCAPVAAQRTRGVTLTTSTTSPTNQAKPSVCNSALCTTPAYGVLLLRRAAVEGELAGLLTTYTEQHPQVAPKKFESAALARELERLSKMPAANAAFLSETYGKILLRKIELETDIYAYSLSNNEPPPVIFNSKKVELETLNKELSKIFGN